MRYLIWFLLISLILVRYLITRPIYHDGDNVKITVSVLTDPINYPTEQYLRLAGLQVYLPSILEVSYGDTIVVNGTVDKGKLDNPKLIKDQSETIIFSGFRNSIISFYRQVLPEPMSGVLAGITLGSKGSLTQDFYIKVKTVGVSFIVGASGIKVTLIIVFLMNIFTLFLPRRKAIPFVLLGIVSYMFISGLNVSLIRAILMSSFIFFGQETGRLVSKWRILFITAGIMLLIEPDWITDIGFILSFVSLISIMLLGRPIRKFLKFIPEVLREGLSVSFAAQIGMTPILFVTFGQLNIWSPVVTLLTLWMVPYVMILGTLGGTIGLVIPLLGKLILYLSYPMLFWFVKVVSIFS